VGCKPRAALRAAENRSFRSSFRHGSLSMVFTPVRKYSLASYIKNPSGGYNQREEHYGGI
jgi:hypothetical protein